jgi:hypothetical protein
MVLRRGLAALAATALVVAAADGCSGLSKGDADIRCNEEQQSKNLCFDTSVYADCESCFEMCGDDCVPQNMCPEVYLCPGQTLPGSSSSSSSGQ